MTEKISIPDIYKIMGRLIISLLLSVLLHLGALAAIGTYSLFHRPPKKVKILFIKPVKLSELKKVPQKAVEKAKQKTVAKKVDKFKSKPANKTPAEKEKPRPKPKPTPTPTPTPEPSKSPDMKEEAAKIEFLKKRPYFKNWSNERIKNLELPPGMKTWEEAAKMTDYLDNEYSWTATPPELGIKPSPGETPQPVFSEPPAPTPTPMAWKEYKELPDSKIYEIRFYNDKTGFIAVFAEDEKLINVSAFPFDIERLKTELPVPSPSPVENEILVKIPENLPPEQIKYFKIPLNEEYFKSKENPESEKKNKDLIILEIIKQYDSEIEKDKGMN